MIGFSSAQGAPVDHLLLALDAADDRIGRHMWLQAAVDWLRGSEGQVPEVLQRMDALLAALAAHPQVARRLQRLWRELDEDLDLASLLAEFGLSARGMFLPELARRLAGKLLPLSPGSADSGDFLRWVFSHPRDSHWVRALPPATLRAWARVLMPERPAGSARADAAAPGQDCERPWQALVLRALSHAISQVAAAGFRADLRQRMSRQARATDCFDRVVPAFQAWARALQAGEPAAALADDLRFLLVEAQWCGASVYEHLEDHGISVEVVFQLRQLRRRLERTHALLDMLAGPRPERTAVVCLAQWIAEGQAQAGVRSLLSGSAQLLAARLAERSAQTGEHYITRDATQYRHMLAKAAGGGVLIAGTAWAKFALAGLGLSLFWGGVAAGLNYALSFLLIYLLHFTVATKQPAMTAPALVARLRLLEKPADLFRFVEEVVCLVRSQFAAIAGNLGAVVPTVALISLLLMALGAPGMVDPPKAQAVLAQHQLLGPSVLFACFTGVLLFASSLVGGWVENGFVLHQLDSALAHQPRLQAWLGPQRAQRLARWLREHVSGLAANVSLGLMLGLVPVLLQFLGLPVEVRHVTLVAGQLTAAAMSLGPSVLGDPAFWSVVLTVAMVGVCNLSVSFYLAFRLALRARSVSGLHRKRIRKALALRLRRAPLSFVWPGRAPLRDSAGSAA